jgi:hypothetical protein
MSDVLIKAENVRRETANRIQNPTFLIVRYFCAFYLMYYSWLLRTTVSVGPRSL